MTAQAQRAQLDRLRAAQSQVASQRREHMLLTQIHGASGRRTGCGGQAPQGQCNLKRELVASVAWRLNRGWVFVAATAKGERECEQRDDEGALHRRRVAGLAGGGFHRRQRSDTAHLMNEIAHPKPTAADLDALANELRTAQERCEAVAPLTDRFALTVADAYAVAGRNIAARQVGGLHGKPARVIGHKIGITSRAVQSWLGVDQPDFGVLLDDMLVDDGGAVNANTLLLPKVEGEIAFVLGQPLRGPGVSVADVLAATDHLLPCIEIIDSRVRDWKIQYEDTIADNASSAMLILGTPTAAADDVDLELCGMVLRKRGQVVSTGAGAACLENPANAVAWLANQLAEFDQELSAGQVVLSGALGPVVEVSAGDWVEVEIAGVGRARCHFVGEG